ncbi:MAG: UDP-N-acetylmuramyl-tripeptide synthetase, partial [Deltaproteobacteria bacterium]|nr:UDP-N-acetylmuramyl-tripeptide synthetase [Deltaproteobacteria bacterium]
MKLSSLAQKFNLTLVSSKSDFEVEIYGLSEDSRQIKEGFIFAALKGSVVDGRDYIKKAMESGAAAILLTEPDIDTKIPRLIAPQSDFRALISSMARLIYHQPDLKLKLAAVTGTNGKTSSAYFIEAILSAAGLNPGLLGTIGYRWPGTELLATNTTPEGPLLYQSLKAMVDSGSKSAVMEVSSHGLALGRVKDLRFDSALFTNLTRDHLDFHGDMESYFKAKELLFTHHLKPNTRTLEAAVSFDDPYGQRIINLLGQKAISFGLEKGATVRGEALKIERRGLSMSVIAPNCNFEIKSNLLGDFNAQNLLGAVAAGLTLGIEI